MGIEITQTLFIGKHSLPRLITKLITIYRAAARIARIEWGISLHPQVSMPHSPACDVACGAEPGSY